MPKITALPAITTFGGDETFLVVDDDDGTPVTSKVTVENLATGLAAQTGFSGTYAQVAGIAGDATGATSSAAAINTAEAALPNGGVAEFRAGTFGVGAGDWAPTAEVHYRGAGKRSTTIQGVTGTENVLFYAASAVNDFEVSDLAIDGTGAVQSVDLTGCRRFALRRLLMKGLPGNHIMLRGCEDFTLEDIEAEWTSATNTPPSVIYLINCRRGKIIRPKNACHVGTVVLQTGCTDIEVIDPDLDGIWFLVPSRYTNSGGTVTYTATTLVDSANGWGAASPAISVNSTVRAMTELVASTAPSSYEAGRVLKTTGPFVSSAVAEGDVVVVGTVWGMVERVVDSDTLIIDGWKTRATGLPAAAPSAATNFVIYRLTLGSISSVAGNTINVVEWAKLDGTVATPAAGALYEVCYNHGSHLLMADDACVRPSITGGRVRRGWGDQVNYQGDYSKVESLTAEFGFDIGIGIEDGTGGKVIGCTTRRNGSSGIYGIDDTLVTDNVCIDDGWNTIDTRLGMVHLVGSRALVDNNRLIQSVLTKATKRAIVVDAPNAAVSGNKIGRGNLMTGFTPNPVLLYARGFNITGTIVPDYLYTSEDGTGAVSGTVTSSAANITQSAQTADFTHVGAAAAFTQLGTIEPSLTITGTKMLVTVAGAVESGASPRFRLNIDSGASFVNLGRIGFVADGINFSHAALVTGLTPGAHTAKVEFIKGATGNLTCRASSLPEYENLRIILEEK